ncbi:MAG: ABC transporter ATP-binding protein [Vulcanimicrobiaceae bacterium]
MMLASRPAPDGSAKAERVFSPSFQGNFRVDGDIGVMALVSFLHVEKVYEFHGRGRYTAVQDFSLQLEAGEFFCLLGPSGCGKTTVLNMLAGFEFPTAGTISVGDQSIQGPGPERAVVFQGEDSLFGWLTARDNVEFGLRMRGMSAKERKERARHYLQLVGLGAQEDKYPSQLSGGMKQRIQIARVLANEPTMLLMDEPFAALDAQTRILMQEQLREIASMAGISVFFVTHDIDEAIVLGSRIGVMKAGPSSTLKDVVDVSIPGERNRTDSAFMAVYRRIYHMIREEVSGHP